MFLCSLLIFSVLFVSLWSVSGSPFLNDRVVICYTMTLCAHRPGEILSLIQNSLVQLLPVPVSVDRRVSASQTRAVLLGKASAAASRGEGGVQFRRPGRCTL